MELSEIGNELSIRDGGKPGEDIRVQVIRQSTNSAIAHDEMTDSLVIAAKHRGSKESGLRKGISRSSGACAAYPVVAVINRAIEGTIAEVIHRNVFLADEERVAQPVADRFRFLHANCFPRTTACAGIFPPRKSSCSLFFTVKHIFLKIKTDPEENSPEGEQK